MLQTAAATCVHDDQIVLIRKLAEDLIALFEDLCRIASDRLKVVVALARDNDTMGFAENVERYLVEIAHLERRVVENVEVRRSERICLSGHLRQSGCDFPVAERIHLNR